MLSLRLAYYGFFRPIHRLCRAYLVVSFSVCSSLDADFSTVGVVFTQFIENKAINLPTYLLVRAYQPFGSLGDDVV